MTLSKVWYINLLKLVVVKIIKGHDKGIVHGLTGLTCSIGVPVKDVRSAGGVEEDFTGKRGATVKKVDPLSDGPVQVPVLDMKYQPGTK